MLKVSTFSAQSELGYSAIPLFGKADREFEKTASAYLLPPVLSYIEGLRPRENAQYVLVNALGASEYFGSNINGDAFPEAALIHAPPGATGNPLVDRAIAKQAAYGYLTFYNAHPFCFPAGTPVVMADRTRKPIEEVVAGDLVATEEGAKQVSEAKSREYAGPGVELRLRGECDALVATADHPLLVYRREQVHCRHKYCRLATQQGPRAHHRECVELREPIGDPTWVRADQVLPGDYLVLYPPVHGDTEVPAVFAELVGWVASEGYLSKDGYMLQFSFSENNEADLRSVLTCLKANGAHVTVTPRPQYGVVMLTASSRTLVSKVAEYVRGVKADKHLLPGVLGWNREALLRMLGAYISGDGHVPSAGRNSGQLRIRSSSIQMLRILSDVIRALGVEATVQWDHEGGGLMRSPTNGGLYTEGGSGCVTVAAAWVEPLLRYTRKNFYTKPAKSMRKERLDGRVLVQVTEREDIELEETVYCLAVPGPHHYFANEVVVHNSHHRNKDPGRAYGEVELAVWNDTMKRVELVVRIDYDKCCQFGGVPVWDKLKAGQFPDVSMGCLPAGSYITMADGTIKPIELVQQADLVLSHTGRKRRVTSTMRRRHEGSVFRFKVYGFRRELILTGNHPLWLVDGGQLQCAPVSSSPSAWTTKSLVARQRHCTPLVKAESVGCATCTVVPSYSFGWRRADEAQVGDYLAFPIPSEEDDTVQSPDLARLLGYYLAEGHVSNYNDRPLEQITFSLGINEVAISEEIEALGRRLGVEILWHYENPEAGARSVTLVSKTLADKCLRWCGSGAKTKQLAREALYMRPSLMLHFLGAYLNGDGGTYKGSAYFSTASEVLSHQIFIALARCGMIASVNEINHVPSERSVVQKNTVEYQVWVGTDFSWKLESVTSKPVRRSKKVRGQRFFYEDGTGRYLMAPIVEVVEEDYSDEVFNFSVQEEESYVAEGLAVHNSKVPFDTSSITLDWKKYRDAQATFDVKKHKHPGAAVLAFHKELKKKDGVGVRGISITRDDYDDWCKNHMNRILPDGRKVFVYNDYPRFFDISFVFIGADRTAKTLVYIVRNGDTLTVPSAKVAHALGYRELEEGEDLLKVASAADKWHQALIKGAEEKKGEIEKEVVPSQLAAKAVPLLTRNEPSLPREVQDALASVPQDQALSSATGMGVVLRPSEFQRITLVRMGCGSLADTLEDAGVVFPRSEGNGEDLGLSPDKFVRGLGRLLAPFMSVRSALGPFVEKRVTILSAAPQQEVSTPPSHPSELLRKIGSAYGAYRAQLMDVVTNSQDLIEKTASPRDDELLKVAHASAQEVFTPLSFCYLRDAFLDEAPIAKSAEAVVETS